MNTKLLLSATAALGLTLAASAQMPAHLSTGLDLVDDIRVDQLSGKIYKPNTTAAPENAYNRYGGSWSSPTDKSAFTLATTTTPAENNSKCAPLVSLLLKSAYAWSWSSDSYKFTDPTIVIGSKKADGSTYTTNVVKTASPYPYQYVAMMKQKVGFPDGAVTDLDLVKPGYIFSLWEPAAGANQDHDHAGVVVEIDLDGAFAYPDTTASARTALKGTRLVPVEILDSSSGVHGADDTRSFTYDNVSYQIAGAGRGTMGFLVDADNKVVGHTWSLPTANFADKEAWVADLHNRLKLQTDREVVFARHTKQPAS